MNKKEVKFLERAYKKEKDAKVKERILMVEYTFKNETLRSIGERLHCDHKLVLYWRKRYVSEGIEGLKTKQKSGKPKLISSHKEGKLKKIISVDNSANPWTTKKVCDLIEKETGIKYTQRHVQRILHRWNFSLLVPRPTFWQKASGKEIKRFWKKNPEIEA